MTSKKSPEKPVNRKNSRIDKKRYEKFVDNVELISIVLNKSHADKSKRYTPQAGTSLSYELSESIEDKEYNEPHLTVWPEYIISAFIEDLESKKKELFFEITVQFEVIYRLSEFDDELWNVFSTLNVPLNTWPYLREYVHNTTMRFGLPPLLLNVRKF